MDDSRLYYVSYRCTNCKVRFEMDFPKGISAPNGVKCPECECETGYKVDLNRFVDTRTDKEN